ncbi:SDR family NAD(P)-dependent oxidoreductase [Jatrophihabitans sp. YIM 134969]
MTSRLQTPFSARTTADEVAADTDLHGRRVIVTGASSGIGIETARTLAARGAAVTLAVRDTAAGKRAADDVVGAHASAAVDVRELDLADLASVSRFVEAWDEPLHVLVNNAGVMALPERTLTDAHVEQQFATNHLGHFRLAVGLHPWLRAAGGARVVSLTSTAHLFSPVLFDDLAFDFVAYTPFAAYGQSKTANALFAVEASHRWAGDGITANAVMPGGIATNLQRHVDAGVLAAARRDAGAGTELKTVQQGAATSVFAAVSPLLEGIGGRYLEDCGEAAPVAARSASDGRHGYAAYALDPDNAARLWTVSERLTS